MKNTFWKLTILPLLSIFLLMGAGCPQPIESIARDGLASSKGVIETAQANWKGTCTASPSAATSVTACVAITKTISAQSLVVDALEAYCGSPAFNAGTGVCQPHADMASKLQEALNNLNGSLASVKALK